MPCSSSPRSASAQPRSSRPMGIQNGTPCSVAWAIRASACSKHASRLAAAASNPGRESQGAGKAHRISDDASVLDRLAAHLGRLIDVAEPPQHAGAVRERRDLRIEAVDLSGPTILYRRVEGLALVEMVKRRRQLAAKEMRRPEPLVRHEAHGDDRPLASAISRFPSASSSARSSSPRTVWNVHRPHSTKNVEAACGASRTSSSARA